MANQPDWLNQRSAAIPFFREDNVIKVVLVTTKPKDKNNWIFPKGQVEMLMTPHESAAKEAFEEAGVTGNISPQVFNTYQHKKWGGKMQVKVFLLDVTNIFNEWPEMKERNRQIVSLKQAISIVQSEQKQTLEKLKQHFK